MEMISDSQLNQKGQKTIDTHHSELFIASEYSCNLIGGVDTTKRTVKQSLVIVELDPGSVRIIVKNCIVKKLTVLPNDVWGAHGV